VPPIRSQIHSSPTTGKSRTSLRTTPLPGLTRTHALKLEGNVLPIGRRKSTDRPHTLDGFEEQRAKYNGPPRSQTPRRSKR